MKRLTLLFGALLAAALCTLPAADAAAQPKPTKYNLCRKHPADGPYIVYDAKKGAYAATADKRGRVRVMLYGGGPVEVRSSRGHTSSASRRTPSSEVPGNSRRPRNCSSRPTFTAISEVLRRSSRPTA